MVKGVNKKVVEINHPKSTYFEKAVFYIKPDASNLPMRFLSDEAYNYIKSIVPPRPRKRLKTVLFYMISLVSTAVITAVVLFIMSK